MDVEKLQEQLQEQLQKAAESGATGDVGGLLGSFSMWTLFFGFAFGVFGWWIFKQGRKKQNFGLIGIGIALMVYPYFVTKPLASFLIGGGLCFGAYKIWNR